MSGEKMDSGDLRHLIEFETPAVSQDEYGNVISAFVAFGRRRARIAPLGATERARFATLQTAATHTLTIRRLDGLQTKMRCRWIATGRVFEIVEILDDPTFRERQTVRVNERVE